MATVFCQLIDDISALGSGFRCRAEKSAVIQIAVPLQVNSHVFQPILNIFFLSLVFF